MAVGVFLFQLRGSEFLSQVDELCDNLYTKSAWFQLLKREPGVLALRCWSLYGRLYLRHFNELDHELDARLRRAYRPASKYMNTFSSPIMIIVAQ